MQICHSRAGAPSAGALSGADRLRRNQQHQAHLSSAPSGPSHAPRRHQQAHPPHGRMAEPRGSSTITAATGSKPAIMVNSMAGKMGQAVAAAVLRAGLDLVPYTLCAAEQAASSPTLTAGDSGVKVTAVGPGAEREALAAQLKQQHGSNLVVVDYTVPDVIHDMADYYVRHRLPFVMGTTGGDRARLTQQVRDAKLHAVIAPNMGKQIVAFQAMFEHAAATFPGAFSGYKLSVVESHQSSKKDTSGTAKAVVASLNGLGLHFDVSEIELVRDPKEQVSRMHVPESALGGHAYHTYQLVSEDGSVMFEFQHNVVGRTTYAEGTVDACLFLHKQIQQGGEQTLFNMVDVLKAGAMR